MKPSIKSLQLFLMVIGVAAFAGCNNDCIQGSGKQITQMRTVDSFTEVETSGSIKLVLKQDSSQSVKVVADDNIQEHLKTNVSGDRLKIDLDGNFCDAGPITVYVSARNLSALEASGAVEVVGDGRINTTDFNLELTGSSKITLDLSASRVKTHSSGSSEIDLKGQAGEHDMDLGGSSEVNAFDFVVGVYDIESSGASKCRINVLNTLNVKSSGASEVEYRGNPKEVKNNDHGASSVKKVTP
jgi:hypothetical protein